MFPNALIKPPGQQRGISLIVTLFLLVGLAVLGLTMTQNRGVQTATMVMSLQSARAVQAALSALDWGVEQAIDNGICNATSTLPLSTTGLQGFSVTLACSEATHTEAGTDVVVYRLTATAEYGSYGDWDYVSRVLEASVSPDPP